MPEDEEERLFHLLQFLSFIKSLELNPFTNCKRLRVKKQNYFCLKFPLSKFVKYRGIKLSNQSEPFFNCSSNLSKDLLVSWSFRTFFETLDNVEDILL